MSQRKEDVQEEEDENEFHDMLLDSSTARHQICGPSEINNGCSKDYETAPPQLETDAERKLRKKSHYIVYLTIFIMSIGFSIVLTGVWPYLQQLDPSSSKEFLGWVIAANPLGQMLAAPFLGWCGNKIGSNRVPFIITIAMFIVGNALYALLPLFTVYVKYIMVASRFIVGVSSANIAVCRSYIASSTKVKERTTAISITAAAQSMGFILGPGIQSGTALAFEKFHNDNSSLTESTSLLTASGIPWNIYSSVGWIAVLMGLINFFLVMPCSFQEVFIAEKEFTETRSLQCNNRNNMFDSMKLDYGILAVIAYAFFIAQCVYSLMEALIVPMTLDLYAWKHETAVTIVSIGLTIAAVMTLIVYAMSGYLAKFVDERKLYLFLGFLPMTIGMLIHFPMGHTLPVMKDCNCSSLTTADHSFTINFPHIDDFNDYTTIIYDNTTSYENTTSLEDLQIAERFIFSGPSCNCSSLGCPTSQKWCYYTPIIEKSQLVVGQFMGFFGFPLAFAFSTAFYSKALGPQPQGFWMGLLTSVGSLGRVLGPLIIINIYTNFGTRWTFGSLFVVLLLTFFLLLSFYKRIVPMPVHDRENEPFNLISENETTTSVAH